uniref:Thioredoxin-1 n=1 Tax=Lygus hesperus TaxID=30085 RepID=A0A0A9WYE5_LYGHE
MGSGLGFGSDSGSSTQTDEQTNIKHCSTLSTFRELLNTQTPVIVNVSTSWCHFCRKIEPIFNNLSHEYDSKILFIKVNGDNGREIVQEYGVTSYPTFISFHQGEILQRVVGADESQLRQCIQQLLELTPKLHFLP